jgi:hypothetical protein
MPPSVAGAPAVAGVLFFADVPSVAKVYVVAVVPAVSIDPAFADILVAFGISVVPGFFVAFLMFLVLVLVSASTGVTDVACSFLSFAVNLLSTFLLHGVPPFYGSLLLLASLLLPYWLPA